MRFYRLSKKFYLGYLIEEIDKRGYNAERSGRGNELVLKNIIKKSDRSIINKAYKASIEDLEAVAQICIDWLHKQDITGEIYIEKNKTRINF